MNVWLRNVSNVARVVVVLGLGQVLWGCSAEDVDSSDDLDSIDQEVKFNNGLIDYYLIPSAMTFGSNSTAAIIRDTSISSCNSSYCTLRTRASLMCPLERYADQSSLPGGCTGFLVGPRQIATAGHCFGGTALSCANSSVVFHWRKDSSGTAANPNILREHIYHCSSIVADGRPEGQDWVIIELDKDVSTSAVTPRGPLPLATRPTTVGTLVGVPQHFAALPMKYSESAITNLPSTDPNALPDLKFLQAEVEVTGASSGAPWIDVNTGQVVGLLSRGPVELQEIVETDPTSCIKEKTSCFTNPGSCANNRPKAVPAWLIRKGSREFSIFSRQTTRPSGTPLVGDFDGDGNGDIFWFTAGSSAHVFWWGDGQGGFTPTSFTLSTTSVPFVLDHTGDGRSDVFFYGPGAAEDESFIGRSDRTFNHWRGTVADTGLVPIPGDFDGNGYEDIFWYNPGTAPDSIWFFRTSLGADGKFQKSYTVGSYTISDTGLVPTAGDYDADGRADILWFDPVGANDRVWYSYRDANGANRFNSVGVSASFSGTTPVSGDFDGDSRADVLWFTPNGTSATLWSGTNQRGTFGSKTVTIPAAPSVSRAQDFDRDSVDDLILWSPANFTILTARTWGG